MTWLEIGLICLAAGGGLLILYALRGPICICTPYGTKAYCPRHRKSTKARKRDKLTLPDPEDRKRDKHGRYAK